MRERTITALIVDDEELGRDVVRHMLRSHADFRIVAECADGERAVEEITEHRPDILFLDVQMPKLNGFALLQRLEGKYCPLTVFITAHGTYAIEAFEARAMDYLLKPFDQERFDQMLARVRTRISQIDEANFGQNLRMLVATHASDNAPNSMIRSERRPILDERVVVKERGRVFFVRIAEIDWLEASGNYVALHVAGRSHLVHETMAGMEARLEPALFIRIHRSTIVNIERITELQPHFNGEYVVVLKDGTRLKLSRGHLERAKTILGFA